MFSAISCTRTAEIVYKSDPQLAPPCPMGSDAGHWLQQLLLIPPGASTLPARQQLIPDSLACTSLPSPSFASSQPLAVSQRSSPLEGALPSSGRRSMVTSSVTQPRLMDAIADASSLQVRKGRRNTQSHKDGVKLLPLSQSHMCGWLVAHRVITYGCNMVAHGCNTWISHCLLSSQEIIDIYEYRIQGLQPHPSSALEHPFYDISPTAITAPGPLPSPLRPAHLASLCSRMARLVIVDQAYKGLSTPDALHLARGLLGQVTGELSARPGDLTIINIEQLLVRTIGGDACRVCAGQSHDWRDLKGHYQHRPAVGTCNRADGKLE